MTVPAEQQVRECLNLGSSPIIAASQRSLGIYDMSNESERREVEEAMGGREIPLACVYVAHLVVIQVSVFVEFYAKASPELAFGACGEPIGGAVLYKLPLSDDPDKEALRCAITLAFVIHRVAIRQPIELPELPEPAKLQAIQ